MSWQIDNVTTLLKLINIPKGNFIWDVYNFYHTSHTSLPFMFPKSKNLNRKTTIHECHECDPMNSTTFGEIDVQST